MKRTWIMLLFLTASSALLLVACKGRMPNSELHQHPDSELHPAEKKGKWGFVNHKGKAVIRYQYTAVGPFKEELAAVCSGGELDEARVSPFYEPSGVRNGKWGFIDRNGQMVVPQKFADVKSFSEDKAWVRAYQSDSVLGSWGVIDRKGNWLVQPQFKGGNLYQNGFADAQSEKSGLWGIIFPTGQWAVPPKYQSVQQQAKGKAIAKDKKGTFLIAFPGQRELAGPYAAIRSFNDSLAIVVNPEGLCGVINIEGKLLVPAKYKTISSYHEGRAFFESEGKFGFFDSAGEVVISPKYAHVGNFQEGFAPVEKAGKFGFVNAQGEEVVPVVLDGATGYTHGQALICMGCKHDSGGELTYGYPDHFTGGKAALIDLEGKVYPIEGKEPQVIKNKRFLLQRGISTFQMDTLNQLLKEITPISLEEFADQ